MVQIWVFGTEPQVGAQRRLEFYVYGLRGNFAVGFNKLLINGAHESLMLQSMTLTIK